MMSDSSKGQKGSVSKSGKARRGHGGKLAGGAALAAVVFLLMGRGLGFGGGMGAGNGIVPGAAPAQESSAEETPVEEPVAEESAAQKTDMEKAQEALANLTANREIDPEEAPRTITVRIHEDEVYVLDELCADMDDLTEKIQRLNTDERIFRLEDDHSIYSVYLEVTELCDTLGIRLYQER